MSSKNFLIIIFFTLACFRLVVIPQGSGDLAVWIADGMSFLSQFSFSRVDTFSIHPNLEFIYPARFSNILFAQIYKFFDLTGVTLFIRFFLFVAIFINFKKYIQTKMPWNIYNLVTISTSCIGMTLFLDRPACFGVLFATLLFPLLDQDKYSKKDYIKIFLILILWSNTHSSLLILLPVIGMKLLLSLKKKSFFVPSLLISLLFTLSLFLTPEGFSIFSYVYKTIFISKERIISEWSPALSFIHPGMSLLYLFSFFTFFITAYKQKKLKQILNSPLIILIPLGFLSIRNAVWFFILIIYLFDKFSLWSQKQNTYFSKKSLNLGLVAICWVYLLYSSPYNFFKESVNNGLGFDAPVKIAELLNRTNLSTRIFNQWELGSYLILKQPHSIFIDTRNIIYPKEIFDEYKKIINCQIDCQILLAEHNISVVVLRKEGWPLIKSLKDKWDIIYEDNHFIYMAESALACSKGGNS